MSNEEHKDSPPAQHDSDRPAPSAPPKEEIEYLRVQVGSLRESREHLETQLTHARSQLEQAHARLKQLQQTRWWRTGVAIRNAVYNNRRRLLTLPIVIIKILFGRRAKERPRATRVPNYPVYRSQPQPHWLAGISATPRRPSDLWVAGILDEAAQACIAPECNLITIRPDNWRISLEERRPHFLLVESASRGNEGSWEYRIGSYPHPASVGLADLRTLVEWCRENKVPTVFWNTTDAVFFERFRDAAVLFDHILTTDPSSVDRYKDLRLQPTTIVGVLPFAAQPRLHNPIESSQPRRSEPAFAGAYTEALDEVLDAAVRFGLEIYDTGSSGFPDRFRPRVRIPRSYRELVRIYKKHKVFIFGEASPVPSGMYEMLACGATIVAPPGGAIAETFGDAVVTAAPGAEAAAAIEHLLNDEAFRAARAAAGLRIVMTKHTYRRRLASIAAAVGFPVDPTLDSQAAVLALADRPENAEAILSLIRDQSRAPAELLVGTRGIPLSDRLLDEIRSTLPKTRLRTLEQEEGAPAARYRQLAQIATAPWVWIPDPSHRYAQSFLEDLQSAVEYASADVIGKAAFATQSGLQLGTGLEHRFTRGVHPHAALTRREVVAERGWPADAGAWDAMADWFAEGIRFYSTDRETFIADPSAGLPSGGSLAAVAER